MLQKRRHYCYFRKPREGTQKMFFLGEGTPVNATAAVPINGKLGSNYDFTCRSVNLIAYDICGVQPMTGPTGLIFAMRSRFDDQSGAEALVDEADAEHSVITHHLH